MNNRPKDPQTARNKNVLVIGGSGSGKTRFFVKPNLMQCVSKDYPTSFVITDPKGSLIGEVGQLLIRSSYRVKVLNTINFSKSMKYNPFRYLHSEKDVLKLVNILQRLKPGAAGTDSKEVIGYGTLKTPRYRSYDAAVNWNIVTCSCSLVLAVVISAILILCMNEREATQTKKKTKKAAPKKGW